jgi:hypothetical protein
VCARVVVLVTTEILTGSIDLPQKKYLEVHLGGTHFWRKNSLLASAFEVSHGKISTGSVQIFEFPAIPNGPKS